jgi:ADP-ribosylglycohydrolase
MAGWTDSRKLLIDEALQRRDEGVAIPARLQQAIDALHPEADAWNDQKIDPIYDELMALPEDAALARREPNDLAAIRALRPAGPRDLGWKPADGDLIDRLHGAWTGRCVGCALGKPVEGMGMSARNGVPVGRARIKAYLERRGDWPLADYFSGRDAGDGEKIGQGGSIRENIAFMEPDDDIHYSLVGLGVMETYGPDFTWSDVAYYWTSHIPFGHICTAETQAVLNFWNRSVRWKAAGTVACTPAWTRRHRNPYREWIGAQIRSDGWAFCAAGRPELAAEFAWRDASWTHERNGIYGEMFLAAMQAAAFVESDPHALVAIGLSEIPADCRLAVAVRDLLSEIPRHADWESCMAWIERRCAAISPTHLWGGVIVTGMNPVHTINNALICVLALIHGRLDPQRTTTISVMCGLDTDCNGASVGSIAGAASGRARFGEHLAARLNDTVKPAIVGFQEVRMRELAERTAAQWRRVGTWAAARPA